LLTKPSKETVEDGLKIVESIVVAAIAAWPQYYKGRIRPVAFCSIVRGLRKIFRIAVYSGTARAVQSIKQELNGIQASVFN